MNSLPTQLLTEALERRSVIDSPDEELDEALFYIMTKVGLRSSNFPVGEEWLLLKMHVNQFFGQYSPDAIRLAFDMAIADRLDLPANEVRCYENFSCLYFSSIMNAYRRWAKEEVKEIPKKNVVKREDHQEDLSDTSMMDWLASLISDVAARPDYPVEFMPVSLYDWLDKAGYVQKTRDEKDDYMDRAIILHERRLAANARENPVEQNIKRRDHFAAMHNNHRFWGEDLELVICLAKRILLLDLIKNKEIAI